MAGPFASPILAKLASAMDSDGDGYFNVDSGLAKNWGVREYGTLKFSWEVYNVTNAVRFDPASIGSGLTSGNLGIASSLLTSPRRMQFALRFDF